MYAGTGTSACATKNKKGGRIAAAALKFATCTRARLRSNLSISALLLVPGWAYFLIAISETIVRNAPNIRSNHVIITVFLLRHSRVGGGLICG
jgi:hypothetical protein